PVPTAGDTLTGQIPDADEIYTILSAGARDTIRAPGPGGGPIEYRGQRLVFYPSGEVIVLEGDAVAAQAGTELAADRILFRSREGLVEAFGDASVSRGPSQLTGDSLLYDRETTTVATFGASVLSENQTRTEGVDLKYDLDRQSGVLGAGVTTYEPWILEGENLSKIGESTFLVDDGHFTTCDLDDPHYTFRSDEIKLRRNDVIVASPVVLYFSDIPVFYLPWYVEPVVRGRHSGFLRPKIGINTLIFGSGRERNVQDLGYYYVFNEYADALLAADWYTESRFIVRFDTRYNLRYSFQGDLHYESVWNRLEDSRSQLVRYRHDHTLSRETRANVDVNWSNRRSFLRQNSFDPEEILQRAFRSAASYSTRFGWGSLVAGADADFRLDVDRTDFRLPDVRLSINQRPLWGRRTGGAAAGERPWFQELQYSASTSFTGRYARAAVDSLGNPLTRLPTDSLGNPLPAEKETVVDEQEATGRLTLSGPLTLLGVIKTTPSVSYNASFDNDELAEDEKLGGRGQFGGGLNLSTRFFRIFDPPVGPFTRGRHVVNPSVSLTYSPRANLFGAENTAEARENLRQTLIASFSLGQDIDVKLPLGDEDEAPPVEEAEEEGAAEAEEAEGEDAAPGDEEEAEPEDAAPEDEEPTSTVNLLNITNSLSYDFIRAREEGQLGFSDLTTRLTTGLGRDFNISTAFAHELVKPGEEGETFDPFLSRITTDFSLRKGGAISVTRRRGIGAAREEVQAGRGSEETTEDAQQNLVEDYGAPEGFGPWSLNLTHSWTRNRDGGAGNRQSLGIGASLLPSANWSLDYRTTYDVTEGELQAQSLALVRNLHDWQATLGVNLFPAEPQDRVLITFSVYLREAPELEIPYRVRRE
ncbi:MAG TPA: putative LPS assembly protein LptD, partial [Gemmatimonadota bacterium]|nr:putative LPS assembly protein LptD [Gemmatimonadota bacterium]